MNEIILQATPREIKNIENFIKKEFISYTKKTYWARKIPSCRSTQITYK
jgi:hypothetical protein